MHCQIPRIVRIVHQDTAHDQGCREGGSIFFVKMKRVSERLRPFPMSVY